MKEEFDRQDFDRMCWTMCARKNLDRSNLLISDDDAFKIWCIFNFLCEDHYPLSIVTEEVSSGSPSEVSSGSPSEVSFGSPPEVSSGSGLLPRGFAAEYFLRKLTDSMGGSWVEERFEDYKLELQAQRQSLSAWELITLVASGHFSKGMDRQTLSMGINEVYHELILDGYLMKKGHKRKNWTERWFMLRPTSISYFMGEDLAEKKGHIHLDENCCVEPLPDKEGKKCLFFIKCVEKSFEISASDKKRKQEWIQ
ncbi:hypothetical protein CRUP_027773, partial [Coryphaenoides rupestris]